LLQPVEEIKKHGILLPLGAEKKAPAFRFAPGLWFVSFCARIGTGRAAVPPWSDARKPVKKRVRASAGRRALCLFLLLLAASISEAGLLTCGLREQVLK